MTEPTDVREALVAQAQALFASGSYREAAECYQRLLADDGGNALLWFNLAVARHLEGDLARAETAYRESLARDRHFVDAALNLGTLLQGSRRAEEAVSVYRDALAVHAESVQLLNNLGNALYGLQRFEEALASYDAAAHHQSDYPEAWNNRGVVLKTLGRLEEAAESFVKALRCKPDYAEAWGNLGNARKAAGDPAGAVECYQHALKLSPQDAHTYSNLANALQQLGMLDEALEFYEVALSFAPDLAIARWNRGLLQLQRGNYEAGWIDYESGFAAGERPSRVVAAPRWEGQPLRGRRLLVYAEQGYGDTLQFVRFLAPLRAAGATVVLECQAPLARLLAHAAVADELVVRDRDAVPPVDIQVPLLSLPRWLSTTLDAVPAPDSYVQVDPQWVAPWRAMLDGLRGIRVGLCWSVNPEARNSRERSCPLAALAALALPGVDLVSLQTGAAAEESVPGEMAVARPDPALDDFAATAALIAELDLVITVDTAVAHLAGALGRPAWVLLPQVADWRWLVGRSDSPWYPSLTLFRQPARGDWSGLIEKVAQALERFVRPGTGER